MDNKVILYDCILHPNSYVEWCLIPCPWGDIKTNHGDVIHKICPRLLI